VLIKPPTFEHTIDDQASRDRGTYKLDEAVPTGTRNEREISTRDQKKEKAQNEFLKYISQTTPRLTRNHKRRLSVGKASMSHACYTYEVGQETNEGIRILKYDMCYMGAL